MKIFARINSFIFIIFSGLIVENALACSFDYVPSVYQSYKNSSFVFVGKPVELRIVENQRIYRFEVNEIFKGSVKKELVINNGRADNMCDAGFEIGEVYLIYANAYGKDEKTFYTGNFATLNEPLTDAQDQIHFLRELLKGKREPQIYGSVLREDKVSDDLRNKVIPLQNIKVKVEGDGKLFEAMTDANGIYYFNKIPRGEYTVKTVLPDVYENDFPSEEKILILKSGRAVSGENVYLFKSLSKVERELEAGYFADGKISDGCYTKFSIHWNNRLKAKVYDLEGKEISAKTKLVLVSNPFEDFSKDNGIDYGDFWGGIKPSKYYLITEINAPFPGKEKIRYFYPQADKPEEATVLDLKGNDRLEVNLTIPVVERKLTGKVFWDDETPITGNVRVFLSDKSESKENKFGAAFLDGTSSFSLSAYVGFEYWLYTDVAAENLFPGQNKPIKIQTGPIKIKVENLNEPLKIFIPKPDKLPTTN